MVVLAYGTGISLEDKYLSNFTNPEIDTKIYATANFFKHVITTIVQLFASFLIDKTATTYALIILGCAFTGIFILLAIYMKPRLGLKPEDYSKEERKYDELTT